MKKRTVCVFTVLAVMLSAATATAAPIAASASTGRGTAEIEQVVAPQYEDAKFFSEGFLPVKKDGKWGYIDIRNNVAIPFEYDYASPYAEGYAVVGKVGRGTYEQWEMNEYTGMSGPVEAEGEVVFLGRIDRSGNYRPFRHTFYDWGEDSQVTQDLRFPAGVFDFSAIFYYYGGWANIGYLIFDTNGNLYKTYDDARFRAVRAPTQGLAAARDDRGEGQVYLDADGRIALDLRGVRYYDEDNALVNEPERDQSRIRYERFIYEAFPFNQGFAYVVEYTYDFFSDTETLLGGIVDMSGKWVIEPQFDGFNFYVVDYLGEFRIFADGGLASVSKGGAFGAVDKNGGNVIPHRYDELWPFVEGLAVFRQGSLYGYIDMSGDVAIPARYKAATAFKDGYALVHDGTSAALIGRSGAPISGAGAADLGVYYWEDENGDVMAHTPGEYITVSQNGLYGISRLTYLPPLPDPSEMDAWAFEEVTKAVEEGLVPASLQNMYRSNITRIEFCRLIMEALTAATGTDREALVLERTGKSLDSWAGERRFNDSADRDVVAAAALGAVEGYAEGDGIFSFRPHNSITRQEAAVLLWRAARILGMDTESAPPVSGFADRARIASWAATQVDFVYSVGVMQGSGGSFDPLGSYTRQQSYMTAYRLLAALGA